MFRYLVRRLLLMVLTFFGATFVVYALVFLNAGRPDPGAGRRAADHRVPAAGADPSSTTSTTGSSSSTGTTSRVCSPATSAPR